MDEQTDGDSDAAPERPFVGRIAGDGEDGLLTAGALAETGLIDDEALVTHRHVHGDDLRLFLALGDLGHMAGVLPGLHGAGVQFTLEVIQTNGEGQLPLHAAERDGVIGVRRLDGERLELTFPDDALLLGAILELGRHFERSRVGFIFLGIRHRLDAITINARFVIGFRLHHIGIATIAGELDFKRQVLGEERARLTRLEIGELAHGDDHGGAGSFASRVKAADLHDAIMVALILVAGLALEERHGAFRLVEETDEACGEHEHDGDVGDEHPDGAQAFAQTDHRAASHVDKQHDHQQSATWQRDGHNHATDVPIMDQTPGFEIFCLAVEKADVLLGQRAEVGIDEQEAQHSDGQTKR